jgi:histidinol-phosphatase
MPTPDETLAARLRLAREAALQAGRITLRYFLNEFQRETKADGSVVTIADRESEQFMRGLIAEAFPDDGILGEEFGEKTGTSGYRWILDPIDGTLSFAQGVPLYGVLVGVEDVAARRCPIGVVHMPALGETVYARTGGGCTWERQPAGEGAVITSRARVSTVDRLDQSVLLSTDFWKLPPEPRRQALARLAARCRVARTWADCYGYVLVATGRAEVMLDPEMKPWDAAPMQAILEEAGGSFTDWAGAPTIYGACGVATNSRVLAEVLAAIAAQP